MTGAHPEGARPSRLSRVVQSIALGLAVSASTSLAAWMIGVHRSMPDFVRRNDVGDVTRRFAFIDIGIAFGVFLVLFVVLCIWRGLEVAERLARRAAPLAATGFVPLLFDHRLWDDRVIDFLTMAASFGFTVCATTRVFLEAPPALPRLRELLARATD